MSGPLRAGDILKLATEHQLDTETGRGCPLDHCQRPPCADSTSGPVAPLRADVPRETGAGVVKGVDQLVDVGGRGA